MKNLTDPRSRWGRIYIYLFINFIFCNILFTEEKNSKEDKAKMWKIKIVKKIRFRRHKKLFRPKLIRKCLLKIMRKNKKQNQC